MHPHNFCYQNTTVDPLYQGSKGECAILDEKVGYPRSRRILAAAAYRVAGGYRPSLAGAIDVIEKTQQTPLFHQHCILLAHPFPVKGCGSHAARKCAVVAD